MRAPGRSSSRLRLLTLLLWPLWASSNAKQPNVVFIMVSNFGFECVNDYGGEAQRFEGVDYPYVTPQMTRMANEGARFLNAHASPISSLSRVKVMTGKYNIRNYVKFGTIDPTEDTFGHAFRNAGYATSLVGKWQLGGEVVQAMYDAGFDRHNIFNVMNSLPHERYVSPRLLVDGEYYIYPGEYGPDLQQEYSKNFMAEQVAADKPFFLYYSMTLPHFPMQPPPTHPDWDPNADPYWDDPFYYHTMVNYQDVLLGDFLDYLVELGIENDTLVIFSGDNGTPTDVFSVRDGEVIKGAKAKSYDYGTHVPLLVTWPGTIPKGQVIPNIIDFSDMYATMMDAANITIDPALAAEKDGVSFLPLVVDDYVDPPPPRDHSYLWYRHRLDLTRTTRYVQDPRYKLYGDGNFYDKSNDILEQNPLTDGQLSRQEKEIKASFQSLHDAYDKLRPDGFPFIDGVPVTLPGIIKATEFDYGDPYVASGSLYNPTYYDTTEDANKGGAMRRYEDVDIGYKDGTKRSPPVITKIDDGEWLEYSVFVPTSGVYRAVVEYSGKDETGKMHFEVDGIPVSSSLFLPPTGSFTSYKTKRLSGVSLPGGSYRLRAVFEKKGMNVEYFKFDYVGPVPDAPPPDGDPFSVLYEMGVRTAAITGMGLNAGRLMNSGIGSSLLVTKTVDHKGADPTPGDTAPFLQYWARDGALINFTVAPNPGYTLTVESLHFELQIVRQDRWVELLSSVTGDTILWSGQSSNEVGYVGSKNLIGFSFKSFSIDVSSYDQLKHLNEEVTFTFLWNAAPGPFHDGPLNAVMRMDNIMVKGRAVKALGGTPVSAKYAMGALSAQDVDAGLVVGDIMNTVTTGFNINKRTDVTGNDPTPSGTAPFLGYWAEDSVAIYFSVAPEAGMKLSFSSIQFDMQFNKKNHWAVLTSDVTGKRSLWNLGYNVVGDEFQSYDVDLSDMEQLQDSSRAITFTFTYHTAPGIVGQRANWRLDNLKVNCVIGV